MAENIVLCGVGGQGILLAARIIAMAAEKAGFSVSTNEIHGMAQRGGSVTAQIRFGGEFHSPLILDGTADALLSLEAMEAVRYAHWCRKDALAVVSAQRLIPVTVSSGAAKYPSNIESRLEKVFSRLVYRDFPAVAATLGNVRMTNTVMLGALSLGLNGIPAEIWHAAIQQCVKPGLGDVNILAFEQGRSL